MTHKKNYYTYILRCADSSYYVGSTDNLEQRVVRHNAGRGPRWTVVRLPVELVYYEIHEAAEQAIQREKQIKKWSRDKKEALIANDTQKLKSLSKCRNK